MRLKVMIADADRAYCKGLMDILCGCYANLEVIDIAQTAEELLQKSRELRADVILFSLSLPGLTETDCLHQIKRTKRISSFVVILEDDSKQMLLRALELHVDDILVKPVHSENLKACMEKAERRNERKRDDGALLDHSKIAKQLFIQRVIFELDGSAQLDRINQKFMFHFVEGYFRVLLVRTDFKHRISKPFYDDFPVRQTVMLLMRRYLSDLCSDFCVQYCINGLVLLLNYPVGSDQAVMEQITCMFHDLYSQLREKEDVETSICVGSAYPHIWEIRKSREEAYSADWSRLERGAGQLSVWEKSNLPEGQWQEKMERLRDRARRASTILDVNEFDACVEELFSLPHSMLKHNEVRQWANWFLDAFFAQNGELLFGEAGSRIALEEIKSKLVYTKSFEEFRQCFQDYFDALFVRAKHISDSKSIKPIRTAMQYVQEHYNLQIRVEDISKKVNLSTSYFSTLFKKQTGDTFSKYVTDYRMQVAKEMLQSTDMTIGEISDALGYADQRYFSKIFKKTIGQSPGEFRKAKD